MEKNIDIPPFYVGQEVVANCNHPDAVFKKGDEFKITSIEKAFCNCTGNWLVTVGIPSEAPLSACPFCETGRPAKREWLFSSSRFSPKVEIHGFISLREFADKQMELISAN